MTSKIKRHSFEVTTEVDGTANAVRANELEAVDDLTKSVRLQA